MDTSFISALQILQAIEMGGAVNSGASMACSLEL